MEETAAPPKGRRRRLNPPHVNVPPADGTVPGSKGSARMNAMAVLPTRWNPFRPSEHGRGSTRRYVGKALAISALVHLSALACILWIQAQRGEDTVDLIRGQVHVVPPIGQRLIPPPAAHTFHGIQPQNGIIVPTDFVDPRTEQPKMDPAITFQPAGPGEAGRQPSQSGDGTGDVPAVVNPDPDENAFVAFDEAPVPTYRPDPPYPEWARENGIEGRIVLHALVGMDGRVRRVTVIRGIPSLSESAEETLYHWTFRPARSGHQPVAVWIEVPFSFQL